MDWLGPQNKVVDLTTEEATETVTIYGNIPASINQDRPDISIEDQATVTTSNSCLLTEIRNLAMSFNPVAEEMYERMQAPTAIHERDDSPVQFEDGVEQENLMYNYWSDEAYGLTKEVSFETISLQIPIKMSSKSYANPQNVQLEERKNVFNNPSTFDEAWNHTCAFQRKL